MAMAVNIPIIAVIKKPDGGGAPAAPEILVSPAGDQLIAPSGDAVKRP